MTDVEINLEQLLNDVIEIEADDLADIAADLATRHKDWYDFCYSHANNGIKNLVLDSKDTSLSKRPQ